MEVWKPVKGFEGYYEVFESISEAARVTGKQRYTIRNYCRNNKGWKFV